MATKRMFTLKVIDSDAFMDMSQTAQLLYFHLAMRTDDDGFVGNPKKIMRMIGSQDDDIKILIAKNFIISFQSGVIVIKHHRMNNNWDSHNCKRTQYIEEFSQLSIKENGAYTLDKTQGLPAQTEIRLKSDEKQSLEENRIEENRIEYINNKKDKNFIKPTLEEVTAYCKERKNNVIPQRFIDYYESNGWKVGGRAKMKDWKACVRTWEQNKFGNSNKKDIYVAN